MADTSSIKLMLELARRDESPLRSEWMRTSIADETLTALFVRASTTGVTVDLSAFSTIDAMVVRNRAQESNEGVRLEYTYREFQQQFAPLRLGFVSGTPDFIYPNANDPADDFDFANSDYMVGARLTITGADNFGNNVTAVIQNIGLVANQRLEFNETVTTFSSDTQDSAGPLLTQEHPLNIPVGPGRMHVANMVHPGDNLVITALANEPTVDIWVLGT